MMWVKSTIVVCIDFIMYVYEYHLCNKRVHVALSDSAVSKNMSGYYLGNGGLFAISVIFYPRRCLIYAHE